MAAIKYIVFILLLFILGNFIADDFYSYSFSELNTENMIIENDKLNNSSLTQWIFSIILTSISLLYLLVQKINKITFIYRGIIVLVIIISSGILLWRLRIYGLNEEIQELLKYDYPSGMIPSINRNNLQFEFYLLGGFIIGTFASLLIFGDRNKSLVK